jgi:hypothetical protein
MNSPSMRRSCSSASVALAFLLAVAPALAAQTASAGQAGAAKIDLNTASQAVLETLPGVDLATATQIIAGRPYTSVGDLSKAGVPVSTIEKITPLVKVGPLGKAAAATGKGAQKAAAGVGKGADATAKGMEKGLSVASKGVQTGAAATASAAGKVARKVTGAPRQPPQAGMVWADTATKIYHKEGDASYGKTKSGKWLTEEEAIKEGYRAPKPKAGKAG